MHFLQVSCFLLSVVGVASTTMTGARAIANPSRAHASESKAVSEPYDYVICGGGLAGCVLADQLTADGTKRVLMIEAGGSDYKNLFIRMPAGILKLFRSIYDWQYETGGEKSCNGRNVFLQRGKVLGGSSCTNVCLHHRGSAEDYNQWKIPGWTAKDVLPYFMALENDKTGRDPEYHGTKGVWVMDDVKYQNPLSKRFLEVGQAAGLGFNDDFNSWKKPQDGVGRFQVSEYNGERVSGATAFLDKAKGRKNLTVRTGCMVRKINFDNSKTARGVIYDIIGDDSATTFQANLKPDGEVILAGGALSSPQMLMCSGVGPGKHLRAHGIPVVHDNPYVGENLQDHPAAVVSFKSKVKGVSVTSKLRLFGMPNPLPVLKWLMFKTGMMTSTGCDHGAFVKTTPAASQADLQIRFLAALSLGPDGMTTYTKFRTTKFHPDGYSFQSVAVRAKSKGRVRLASSNSHVKPMIDGGYLSNSNDLATLRAGIKLGRVLGNRPEWGEYLGEEVYPGPSVQTDDEIDEYIRNSVHTANALTGTCKMGVEKDCVVGPDLKVIGVNGVRVADSSVFPNIPGGQTATPTVMIAARAAEMILTPPLQAKVEVFRNDVESTQPVTAVAL